MDIRQNEKSGFFPKLGNRHSLTIRIWHWGNFVLICGALITVLFAKTIFSPKTNIPVVQKVLQKNHVSVTDDVAKSVVHEFSDHIWHWHIIIGYVLAGFVALRIIAGFLQPAERRIIPSLKNGLKYLKMSVNKEETRHFLLVKSLYLLFYLSLFIQACTGLFMAYSDDVPELKSQRHLASNIHSVIMWVIISFAVLHVIGVVRAEFNKKTKGLVSAMINGEEN
jgi:cytochrome b